jgi:hypothetical protein
MIDDQLNMGFIPAQGCWFCLLMNSFFGAGLTLFSSHHQSLPGHANIESTE